MEESLKRLMGRSAYLLTCLQHIAIHQGILLNFVNVAHSKTNLTQIKHKYVSRTLRALNLLSFKICQKTARGSAFLRDYICYLYCKHGKQSTVDPTLDFVHQQDEK